MHSGHTLNNALHLFAPLRDSYTRVRSDLSIETPIGYFRVAYSQAGNSTALFYARHPDDLSGTKNAKGLLEIDHKDRINLVRMYPVYHSNVRWRHLADDHRQHLDLDWVETRIVKLSKELPRAQFREACLHRTGPNHFSSAFVGYEIVQSENDSNRYAAYIRTKPHEHYRLSEDGFTSRRRHKSADRRFFLVVARNLLNHGLSDGFRLKIKNPPGEIQDSFLLDELRGEVVPFDFSTRQHQIWDGLGPVRWKDHRALPIVRVTSAIQSGLQAFRGMDGEEKGRKVLAQALQVAAGGYISAATSYIIDRMSEIGGKRHTPHALRGWENLIDNSAHRFVAMESMIHEHLKRPSPDGFRDLVWLNPETQLPDFGLRHENPAAEDRGRAFYVWLKSLILSPYDTVFEYIGAGGQTIHPFESNQVRFVKARVSNGVDLYFVPDTNEVFAYYHRPHFAIDKGRHLPPEAAVYFQKDQVLCLTKEGGIQSTPFKEFEMHLSHVARAHHLHLAHPQRPLPEVQNPASVIVQP